MDNLDLMIPKLGLLLFLWHFCNFCNFYEMTEIIWIVSINMIKLKIFQTSTDILAKDHFTDTSTSEKKYIEEK